MTEQEKQEIKAELIELGFWGANDPGDPLTNKKNALVLRERLVLLLRDGVLISSGCYSTHSPARHIKVVWGDSIYQIANGDNYPEAICLAALALPEFLRQHPECAADRT